MPLDTHPTPGLAPLWIRRAAVTLWLISLVVPTATRPDGSWIAGAQAALAGLAGLLLTFPLGLLSAPVPALGLLSNGLLLGELWRQARGRKQPLSLPWATLLLVVAAFNLALAREFSRVLPDLLRLPGYPLWAASFVLLAGAAAWEHRRFFAGLLQRSVAVGAVAMLVIALGLALIVLGR